MKEEELEYMQKDYVQAILRAFRIADSYSTWQDNPEYVTIELAEFYKKKGIACIYAGDEKKIMYMPNN